MTALIPTRPLLICLAAVLPVACLDAGSHRSGNAADGGVAGVSEGGAAGELISGVVQEIDLDQVWSGQPVGFSLFSAPPWQFAAYYDADRQMTIARRRLESEIWEKTTLPSTLGWDSHNRVVLAADALGFLHVSGNMHNDPLVYFRSTQPFDARSIERVEAMVGRDESSVTFPSFVEGPEGDLIFTYRDGGSGNGNQIFNRYDAESRTWGRLFDSPFTDGEGRYNAYLVDPVRDDAGVWHLVWVWRDTPDAATNHDLCYARSRNLVDWETAAGDSLELPITLTASDIVDPVPSGGGIKNHDIQIGFDGEGRPLIAYVKFDESGNTQLYNARFEAGAWVSQRASNWDYRWELSGAGTLVIEIEVWGVEAQSDGSLLQRYHHAKYGDGAFRLDPDSLRAVADIDPPLPYPLELAAPRSGTPGMVTRWQFDRGTQSDAGLNGLRWETLDSNRDMPREQAPPPTPLLLYVFERP